MTYSYDSADEYAYSRAKRLGGKAYHAALQRGENPYLPVLDELVPDHLSLPRISLGLVTVPTDRLVGTNTRGRTSAFACNFMPLLDEGSEFALKWGVLHHSVVKDGVRDPIKLLEYMNKFYVVEGNKRVSVLKYFEADSISATVTRVMPQYSDNKEIRLYYEFVEYYPLCGLYTLTFTQEGSFEIGRASCRERV